jgi:hypothetical protein
MGNRIAIATVALLVAVNNQTLLTAAPRPVPLRNGRAVVATVNDDAISLDEFVTELGSSAERAGLRSGRATADQLDALERVITIKLVTQEAERMGLDEIPEIRKQVEVTSREILREVLIERLVRHIKPDAAAVEKRFREMVREWKTVSLLFQDEQAAKRARTELAAGASFSDLAARTAAAKLAKTDTDDA